MIHPEKNINHHYVTSSCHAVSQQGFKSPRKNSTFDFLSTWVLDYCKIMNIKVFIIEYIKEENSQKCEYFLSQYLTTK